MSKRVAIVGASADRSKYGNKSLRAHVRQGWDVCPVNPRGGTIEGLQAYRSLSEVPRPVHRVSMYVPPELGRRMLPDIAALQPAELFVNPGAESDALIEEAKRLGLDPIVACSIMDLGESPDSFT